MWQQCESAVHDDKHDNDDDHHNYDNNDHDGPAVHDTGDAAHHVHDWWSACRSHCAVS